MTRFTQTLLQTYQDDWHAAVTHRFIDELYRGVVDDDVMRTYLIQDHRFIDGLLGLIGGAMLNADTLDARLRYGRFAGTISSTENTYFLRAFGALGVTEADRRDAPDTAPTIGFKQIMDEAGASASYAACLSVLTAAEGMYLEWASRAPVERPGSFVFAEWIDLHDNPDFREFVAFMRTELDRVGPAESERCHDIFGRTVALERAFFDAAYQA